MEGASGARRNMASLDRKLDRVLAYGPAEVPEETDFWTVLSAGKGERGGGKLEDVGESECVETGEGFVETEDELVSYSGQSAEMSSDADSLFKASTDELDKRSPAASAITSEEAGDKCSSGKQVIGAREKEGNGIWNEQRTSVKKVAKEAESAGTAGWTDDRHTSYLNSIEATFVRNMYDNEYDQYCRQFTEQTDQDCDESYASGGSASCTSNTSEVFELWRSGGGHFFYRPQVLDLAVPTPAVFHSPWVQRFNRKSKPASVVADSKSSGDDKEDQASAVVAENTHAVELEEDVGCGAGAASEKTGVVTWHGRFQRQQWKSTRFPSKKGIGIKGKRWRCASGVRASGSQDGHEQQQSRNEQSAPAPANLQPARAVETSHIDQDDSAAASQETEPELPLTSMAVKARNSD